MSASHANTVGRELKTSRRGIQTTQSVVWTVGDALHRTADVHDNRGMPRRRALLVGIVVLGWIGVQLAVPAIALVQRGNGARPRTFAWQMFSHELEAPAEQFTVVTATGEHPADLRPLLSGPMRREIVYAPTVVAALCEDPSVIAVRVVDVERGASTRPCR
ncbi:MAG: hypothetical protein R2701_06380 [Acidimicrobiales bacterium]